MTNSNSKETCPLRTQNRIVASRLHMNRRRYAALAVLLLASAVGCNSDQLATHPVDGVLKYEDGTYPMFGNIEFYNESHKINARGTINRDGTFTVGTYEDSDGAVEGRHQIVIQQITGDSLTEKLSNQIKHDHGALLDSAYFDYRTSDLECVISPGRNQVELTVRPRPKQTEEGMPSH
ncbi:MAG: hypothetical protein AB8B55_21130 [Mariniblastus sp.]